MPAASISRSRRTRRDAGDPLRPVGDQECRRGRCRTDPRGAPPTANPSPSWRTWPGGSICGRWVAAPSKCLVRVGAWIGLGGRQAVLESLDRMRAPRPRTSAPPKSVSCRSSAGSDRRDGVPRSVGSRPEVSPRQQLQWEKELLGIYVSDHPLTRYLKDLAKIVTPLRPSWARQPTARRWSSPAKSRTVRPFQTRSGKPMGFVTLEDLQGTIELVVFPRLWNDVAGWIEVGRHRRWCAGRSTASAAIRRSWPTGSPPSSPSSRRCDSLPGQPPVPASRAVSAGRGGRRRGDRGSGSCGAGIGLAGWRLRMATDTAGAARRAADGVSPNRRRMPTPEPEIRAAPGGRYVLILTILLESTGDTKRDALRMRRVHGSADLLPRQ